MWTMWSLFKSKPKPSYKIIHSDIPVLDHLPILPVQVTEGPPPGTCSSTSEVPVLTASIQNISFNINKPEPFKNQDPKDWIIQYDVCSKANGWDDQKKLDNIPPLFQHSSKARQWYSYTYKNKPPTDYADFCQKLKESLSPSNEKYVTFTKMFERKQQIGEPPIEYFFAKMDLLEKYEYGTMDNLMKVDFLVDGLLPEFKRHVFGKFTTPDEVFKELRKLQTIGTIEETLPIFYNNYPQGHQPNTSWSNNKPQIPYPRNQFQQQQRNYGQRYNGNRQPTFEKNNFNNQSTPIYPQLPDNRRLCHFCASPDHFIRYCPVRNQQQQQNFPANQPSAPPKN